MNVFLIILYSISMTLIMLYCLVQFDLALRYSRFKQKTVPAPINSTESPDYPFVTVQLPIYNEKYVVARLLKSVCQLDYPSDRFEIQILDDSTDDTTQIIKDLLENRANKEIQIDYIHREKRSGYKSGALLEGLKKAKGELISIFDADFIPERDFLIKTIPYFSDPEIGLVQTRWGHINENYSVLTRLQAFGLNAHFTVEQVGRSTAGSYINFNGTAGVWRKKCITESGNWAKDVLSEDLDLSYRAQLKGWKFKYLEQVITPAELPVVIDAVRSQQFRWSKGGAQAARKNLSEVLKKKLSWTNKIHAFFHLLNSLVFPLLLLAAITSIPLLGIRESHPGYHLYFDPGAIYLIGFLGLSYFYWVPVRYIHPEGTLKYYFSNFPLFLIFSMGLSFQNTIAVLEGLLGIKTEFVRTPKFNIRTQKDSPKDNKYFESRITWQNFIELLLFLYFLYGAGMGFFLGNFGLLFLHLMLAAGFAGIAYYTLKPFPRND
jgi:cellulose synthase/poly-beta-1,6-N-acetylglucosamine synthase-like glycosyltransferase